MTPTVSLLVPVFNRADLLVPCLDSALAQTWRDLEIVVVDGASTDGTWNVCERYAAADPRVRIFRDPVNTGPVRGWWRCLEEARGTYGTFLWSDDLIQPTFIERTLPLLSNWDVAFAFTAAEIGQEPGQGVIRYSEPTGLIPSRHFIRGSLRGTGRFPVSPACALFRLSDLRRSFTSELPTVPATDLTSTGAGTDLLLYLLTALRYPRVACLSEPLSFFRAHPGSLTIEGRQGLVARNYALAKVWYARTHGYADLERAVLARYWLHEMRKAGRFVRPDTDADPYRGMVRAWELVVPAASDLLSVSVRTIGSRIRAIWPTRGYGR